MKALRPANKKTEMTDAQIEKLLVPEVHRYFNGDFKEAFLSLASMVDYSHQEGILKTWIRWVGLGNR